MRKMLTNALWELVRPHIRPTGRQRCGAKPQIPDRLFLEALLYIARTGCPWRDLPAPFGAWDAVYNRFRRWVASGRLRKLFEAVTDHPELGEIPRLFVDSTVLRAHAHAAGAARKKKGSGPNARARSRASARAAAGTPPKSGSR